MTYYNKKEAMNIINLWMKNSHNLQLNDLINEKKLDKIKQSSQKNSKANKK
jgi:predicted small metal-binding protein